MYLTAKALSRILLAQHENIRWPSTSFPLDRVVSAFSKRLNEMSGPYQVTGVTTAPLYYRSRATTVVELLL